MNCYQPIALFHRISDDISVENTGEYTSKSSRDLRYRIYCRPFGTLRHIRISFSTTLSPQWDGSNILYLAFIPRTTKLSENQLLKLNGGCLSIYHLRYFEIRPYFMSCKAGIKCRKMKVRIENKSCIRYKTYSIRHGIVSK